MMSFSRYNSHLLKAKCAMPLVDDFFKKTIFNLRRKYRSLFVLVLQLPDFGKVEINVVNQVEQSKANIPLCKGLLTRGLE